jgi:hypothetical protein
VYKERNKKKETKKQTNRKKEYEEQRENEQIEDYLYTSQFSWIYFAR